MDDISELLRMARTKASPDDWHVCTESEFTAAQFLPIRNLQTGDVLKPKPTYTNSKVADFNDTVTVFRTDIPDIACAPGQPLVRYDFTVLVRREDGSYMEFGEDSRNFERVPATEPHT